MSETTSMDCSPAVLDVLTQGVIEVSGELAARSILNGLTPLPGQLQTALVEFYGPRAGWGVAVRIGRAAFKYGLARFGHEKGAYQPEFRLLPAPQRIGRALNMLADVLAEQCDLKLAVENQPDAWLLRVRRTTAARAEPREAYLLIGVLQECMQWASNGRFYPVTEVSAVVENAEEHCIRIDKKHLE